ncbi:PGF-pre-PGF domain-containing protein, partial [archaeon]|nr:PGF-pre-PGF domain-containing protein [archaeon]
MPQIRHGSTLQWINSIYNTTGGTISNSYNLTTNENGVLPSFTISLNENSEMAIITDIDPPNIILISPGNTTSLSAGTTFIWINITTDENAVCRYNLINSSFAYSDGTNFTNTGSTSHSFLYSGLSDGTTYSLYYKCNDSYGNINADSVYHVFSVSSPAQQTTTTTSSSGGGGGGGSTTTKTITVLPKNDIEKVVVNLKSALSGASVTVAKVETVPVSAPKEPVYQYINITKKNFNNSQINNATIDFKVNKSWILQNNFTMIWLARYENGWNKLKTDLLNSTATVNYYRAYTNAF